MTPDLLRAICDVLDQCVDAFHEHGGHGEEMADNWDRNYCTACKAAIAAKVMSTRFKDLANAPSR